MQENVVNEVLKEKVYGEKEKAQIILNQRSERMGMAICTNMEAVQS